MSILKKKFSMQLSTLKNKVFNDLIPRRPSPDDYQAHILDPGPSFSSGQQKIMTY